MVERPSYRVSLFASRPITRARRALGRHQTLWRVAAGLMAVFIAFLLPNESPSEAVAAKAALAAPTTAVPTGTVGIAIPRTVVFPQLKLGDLVHVVVATDPLIVGEERPTEVVMRDVAVIDLDDAAVTISVPEQSAVTLVDALVKGTVVLILSG